MAASNLFSNSMATPYEAYQEQLNRDMRRQVDQMNAIGQGALAGGGGGGGVYPQEYWQQQKQKAEYERMKYEAQIYKNNPLELKQRALGAEEKAVSTTKRRKALLLLLKGA